MNKTHGKGIYKVGSRADNLCRAWKWDERWAHAAPFRISLHLPGASGFNLDPFTTTGCSLISENAAKKTCKQKAECTSAWKTHPGCECPMPGINKSISILRYSGLRLKTTGMCSTWPRCTAWHSGTFLMAVEDRFVIPSGWCGMFDARQPTLRMLKVGQIGRTAAVGSTRPNTFFIWNSRAGPHVRHACLIFSPDTDLTQKSIMRKGPTAFSLVMNLWTLLAGCPRF